MGKMENMEMRLLRCVLEGSREFGPNDLESGNVQTGPADDRENSDGLESVEEGIREVLGHIESGFFSKALASRWWSALFGENFSSDSPAGKEWKDAEEFYRHVKARASTILSLKGWDGREEQILEDEEERYQRELLLMTLGVAGFCAFVQANMTGPIKEQFPVCPAHVALGVNSKSLAAEDEQKWDAWARDQLMEDGCDILGKISLPQYLIMANLLLVNPAEPKVNRNEAHSSGPRSKSWWTLRVLLMQQRVLAERSATLRFRLVSASQNVLQNFGTIEAVGQLGCQLTTAEAKSLVAAAHLEIGLMQQIYGHDDAARQCFDRARQACGLQIAITGVLGFRTQYQVEPKAQLVLVAGSHPSSANETNWLDILDVADGNLQDTAALRQASEVHLAPKLVDNKDDKAGSTVPSQSFDGGEEPLNPVKQAIILAMGVDELRRNRDDELQNWQLAPYIEAVDNQQHSHPMVKAWCQLLRIRWEQKRPRTRERSFLMMEKLADDIQKGAAKVSQRMLYVVCVPFPILPALLKEYAELMVAFGLIGDAMKLFEELELWNNLIDSLCLLGKKTAAAGLIRRRLELQPDEPRLWCSLGDVTLDDTCYHKAWELSGRHYTRAQRSLARAAYNRADYVHAVEHWELALALNPLHPEGWFAFGSAALKARDLDKALVAFTRQVQLDPDNGESWNNIAAINLQRRCNKKAFVAFKQALKLKQNSWQIWENFGPVALDVENFGQAVLAVEKVFDLSGGKHVDMATLAGLVEELEVRKGFTVRQNQAPLSDSDGETSGKESQNEAEEEEDDLWASMKGALLSTVTRANDENEEAAGQDVASAPSSGRADDISAQERETGTITDRTGKLLCRIVASGSGGGEIWGLKARWHKLVGDTAMQVEALLKQVRAYQGGKWQKNLEQFQIFASACLQLCELYTGSSGHEIGKRDLFSAQMLLRSTVKQGEAFKDSEQYKKLVACLDKLESKLQILSS